MGKKTTLLEIRIQYLGFTFVTCFLLFAFTGFSQSVNPSRTDPGKNAGKGQNSALRTEDLSLREEYSRTFKNPDGTFTKQQSKNPLHYKDAQGKWLPVQEFPERNEMNPRLIEISRVDLPVSVNTENGVSKMFLKKDGMISFGKSAKVLWLNNEGSITETMLQSGNIADYHFDNNEVVLKNIFPQVDRKQQLDYDHLRTDYILNQQPNLPASVEYVVFEDEVTLPAGWNIKYGSGEMTNAGWKGDLVITDEKGTVSGNISIPVFYDAFSSSDKSLLAGHMLKGTYKIVQSAEGFRVQILVPSSWLSAPGRVYPVTVDPTVSGTKAQYGNVYGFAFNATCQETLVINVPAGTITGTATTYSIVAQNGGYRSEQVSRVGSDTWSANQTNTTASAGTQNYNLTGLTIANGLWCGGNKTFTWQAYRTWDLNGDASCNQSHQYRTGNWVVDVTYTAAAPPVAPASVGWTAGAGTTMSTPLCNDWSGTACAGSGTYTDVSLTQNVNYTVENTGAATCGSAMANAYLQAWSTGGSTCGYTAIGSPGTGSATFNAAITGNHRIAVSSNFCGTANTCGSGIGHDFTGQSAVLRYRQNTTVTNTTSTSAICLSGTKTLTAVLGGGHNNPDIVWSIVSGGGSIASGVYTPSATGSVTIRATVGLCSSDVTFAVDANPVAAINASLSTVCSGQSSVLTASGGDTYSWSPPAGLDATTGAVVNASPSSTETYTVTATDANGCTATATVTITVGPGITVGVTSNVSDICPLTEAATLTATGASTYSWSPATGLSAVTGSIVTASPATTQTYTVTGTTGGCSASQTITVNVYTPPVAAISATLSAICPGETTELTASGGDTYTWSPATGLDATTGAIVNASPSSAQTYTVVATDANGCVDSESITITVKTNPVITAAPVTANLCAGNNITLTGSGGVAYVWLPTMVGGANISVSPTVTTVYTVLGTGANGCVGQATSTITVTTPPSATITYPGSPFCSNISAPQPVTRTGTSGGTYSAPAGLTINASTGEITPSSSTPGTYTVTYSIAASGGCALYTRTTSVTITAVPTASILYSGSPFCGNVSSAQAVTRTGTSGGTYAAGAGLSIDPATGAVTPSASATGSYTVSYTMAAAGGCPAVTANAPVVITPVPSATILYASSPYCTNLTAAQPVTHSGTTGGTYSSTPGLTINSSTGAIVPSSSTPGIYTVTYTVAAAGGCPVYTTTTSVTITELPAASISYAGSPFCGNLTSPQAVTLTGTTGGTYSSSSGLTIDVTTGEITPSSSTAGVYVVSYTIPAGSGCPAVVVTTSVTITTPPSATISYAGSPYCTSITSAQAVTHSGSTGGTYSSTAGLSINASTGAITPSTSTGGTYTVSYTIPASNGCPVYVATASVTINPLPVASISYAGSPFCGDLAVAQPVTQTGTTGGSYTAPAGLSIDATTGAITPSGSTAGIYTVTYRIAAANSCPAVTATTSVTITVPPSATISYAGSPFCENLSAAQLPTRTGTSGGTYSSAPGLAINSLTGAIAPSVSSPGTYTVTYTIAAAGGCPVTTATTSVTINPVPVATISYAGSPFCGDLAVAQPVTQTGTAGGTYSAPAGLVIDPVTGAVTPLGSTPGTYTVTYTMVSAGCPTATATTSVIITNPPAATISYAGSPFCSSTTGAQPVTRTGTSGGTYSSTSGLSINATTGAITPSASTAGTYTVTYTIPAAGGCPVTAVTASVTINQLPAATISYAGSPFCGNVSSPQGVTLTGATGGTFSAPSGLSIDPVTGAITPSASTTGIYSVTYTITSGGCPAVTANTSVSVTASPSATISYAGSPFCSNTSGSQPVTRTGTTGGTYSSATGLTINPSSGAIVPSSSTPGTYTVTYTMAATGGCPVTTATTSVTINPIPVATISYAGSPFCGNVSAAQAVTQTGTTGGTYNSTAGLTINATTGAVTPSSSTPGTYTVTYTIPAGSGCPAVTSTTSVTVTAPLTATISYAGSPFCSNTSGSQPVTRTGSAGGTYSSTAGLTINATTGAVTPSSSTPGTYTVTYTIPATGGCPVVTATASVTINPLPVATISYAGSPFCGNVSSAQAVTQTGTTGGIYSSTAGLTINATTGAVTPSSSTPGTYTVTYTVPAGSGCPAVTSTTSVTVTAPLTAAISYAGSPFCSNVAGAQSVTRTGAAGGTYSSTAGLTINATTGAVTPSSSTPGIYTVTYTIPATGGCPVVTATTSVTINPLPVATISYAGPFCISVSSTQPVTQTGTTGGTYSAPAGLTINAATGAVTPSTSTAGTYTVTYTIPAGSGCPAVTATTSLTINPVPSATISYAGSPFCGNLGTVQLPVVTGTSGGSYSAPAGLSINASTGAITPSASTAGTYTVTYTMSAGGCPPATATTSVTITPLPSATIAYTGSPFCGSISSAQSVTETGTTGGTYSAPAGLTINAATGAVTPSSSTPGTYTVTYTIPASAGCPAVSATASVVITPPVAATISYAGSPFCSNTSGSHLVTRTGTTGGTYSAPAGLTINAATGAITPSTSTPGTYTVTYTMAASGGCPASNATATVIINPLPVAAISYAGLPFCGSESTEQWVTQTGASGGTFSAPAGLSVDGTSGDIVPSASTPGTYTVTYTIPASSGCPAVTATTSVTITTPPSATISYAGPFCINTAGSQAVARTGTAGGSYTAPAGLTIDAATGAITPSSSTAGTYTVTYTTPPLNGCPAATATASVTIHAVPSATISYAGSPFCGNLTVAPVTQTGTTGGVYTSSPAGLNIDASTGDIMPVSSAPGTYTISYTLTPGGCAPVTTNTSVTINPAPSATISYAGSPFCISVSGAQPVTFTGTTGGTYTAPAGLVIDATTGAVTPSASIPGTYTVTYTMIPAGGCPSSTATASVTVSAIPSAAISYSGSPFCGSIASGQAVNQTGTTGGIYSAPSGLSIDATTGDILPSASTAGTYLVTYTIPSSATGCATFTTTASVTVEPAVSATIAYTGSPYCGSVSGTQAVTLTGTAGGTFSAPAGLSIDATTGAITASASAPGTYTVTYAMAGAGTCPSATATATVVIGTGSSATIAYNGAPFCTTLPGTESVTLTGTTGGSFSSVPAGLTINATTGAIVPSSSAPGTYTVSYTLAASGSCPSVTATTSVTINASPSATISYSGSPFCTSAGIQAVVHTGAMGGTFSAPAGLSIDATTGAITPSSSTPGTYTVTYTIAASGTCTAASATASVTVIGGVSASISYAGSPYCVTLAGGQPVTLTGTTGGTYSAPAGLTLNAATGEITPSTSTPGTYTVTYTITGAGACASLAVTASVTVNAVPSAVISYTGSPFCTSISAPQFVNLTGTAGGTYSATPAGLTLDAVTGEILPSTSAAGIYTVSYNVNPGGCTGVTVTATVEIVASPTASISYSGPYCSNVSTPQAVVLNGTGTYTGGTFSSTPAGLSINALTGAITPTLSTGGVYLVTYTIPASSGCSSGTATTNVTISTAPAATISYAGSPFCGNLTAPQPVTHAGTSGGTYSAPAGLSLNVSTGAITPASSAVGTYVVTYITPSSGGCAPATATSTVEILSSPDVNDLADQDICDGTYTLPAITGTSLTGNEGYYTGTGGTGIAYAAGSVISSTTTLYIYDINGTCSDQETFTVTINQTPVLVNPGAQTACGTYTLPAISGSSLSGSEGYYNNSQASGGTLISGNITSTQTVWIYDTNGSCSDEESFVVTINPAQDASFTATDYCGAAGTAPVVTGTTGGTFTFNPAVTDGATIDAATGLISGGIPGTTYTIEYSLTGICPASTQQQVTVQAIPASPVAGNDTSYCSTSVFVAMNATAGSGGTLTWYNDAALSNQVGTGASVVPSSTLGLTTYYVTETVNGCEGTAAAVNILVNAAPAAPSVSSNVTYCFGDTLQNLQATGTGGSTFNWYANATLTNLLGSGSSLAPFNSIGTQTYYATQTEASGCESVAASVTITINDCFELTVPSAFTPSDGDNVNNTWEIPELSVRYPNSIVTIFNRWGELLFTSDKGYPVPWDGKYKGEDLPVGSYFYIIEFHSGNMPNGKGTVSIIRN